MLEYMYIVNFAKLKVLKDRAANKSTTHYGDMLVQRYVITVVWRMTI